MPGRKPGWSLFATLNYPAFHPSRNLVFPSPRNNDFNKPHCTLFLNSRNPIRAHPIHRKGLQLPRQIPPRRHHKSTTSSHPLTLGNHLLLLTFLAWQSNSASRRQRWSRTRNSPSSTRKGSQTQHPFIPRQRRRNHYPKT